MPLFMPSVAVLVRHPGGGDLVVVGRHRDVGRWVIPGGALEPGELPADCAVREVWEETGLEVEIDGLAGVYAGTPDHRIEYPNGDVVDYVIVVFEATVSGGELAESTEELRELRWVDRSELAALDAQPWIATMLSVGPWDPPSWRPPAAGDVS